MTLDYLSLKGVQNINESQLSSQLESNIKEFLNWGFLGIGAFFNVSGTTSGVYGGDFNRLRRVSDPIYASGQIWEGARKEWIWETGIGFNTQPIQITGVSVNGVESSSSGAYPHYISYPLGRVVFTGAMPTGSEIRVNYSYRFVQVYTLNDAPWWEDLQFNSFRPDFSSYNQIGSGDWSILSQHRVQLPAIVLEAVPRGSSYGVELGNGALWFEQDVLYHVLAETKKARDDITDILMWQSEKTIKLFNVDSVARSGVNGLDYRGALNISGLVYPSLVEDYSWFGYKCRFHRAIKSEVENVSNKLYQSTVRVTCEIALED